MNNLRFKLGDRVRFDNQKGVQGVGYIARVYLVPGHESSAKQYMVKVGGSSYLFFNDNELEPVEDIKPEPKKSNSIWGFNTGDKVKIVNSYSNGDIGVIVDSDKWHTGGFIVEIEGKKHSVNFTNFQLIERPKRKEKRTVSMWANVYPTGEIYAYPSKEEAELGADKTAIAIAVEMTGEYEVEVE